MNPNAAPTPTPSFPTPSNMQFDADTMGRIQQAQQAGYSPDQIATLATQYQLSKGGMQPSQTQQPQSSGLLDWLPTIGGIGGSLLGTALGPLGTIGGGAAGAGLGDVIKSILGGQQINPGDVVKQAAIGGVGGAAGEVLGPVFKFGGKLLSDALPDALDNAGTGFVASQYNVPRSAARAFNMGDTLQQLSNYGIHNINDVIPAADQVTGANGLITQLTKRAVANASPVDTSGLSDMASNLTSIMPTTGDQKILNFVDKQVSLLNGGPNGTLSTNADPSDVFGVIQSFEKKAAEINRVPMQARTQEAINTSHIYQQMADELRTRLFEGRDAAGNIIGPGADQAVTAGMVTPEEYAQLQAISPQLAQDVMQAQTVKDLRGIAAPFVKGSQLANETEAGSQIGFNNVGGAVKGVGKLVQNPLNLLAAPLGSDTVNAAVGGKAQQLADLLRTLPALNPDLLGMAAKGTGQVGAQALLGGSGNTPAGPGMDTSMTGDLPNTATGVGTNLNISPYNQKINSLRNLIGTLMFVMPTRAADLKSAFDFLYPTAASTANSQLNAQRTTGMMNVIDQMLQMAPQATGIGPFANIIQHAEQKTGLFGGGDPTTLQLQANAMLLKQMIATEVHRRGMSAEALQAMNDAFPDVTESHGAFIQKLANLKNVLGTYFGEYGNSVDPSALPAVSANYSGTPAGAFGY